MTGKTATLQLIQDPPAAAAGEQPEQAPVAEAPPNDPREGQTTPNRAALTAKARAALQEKARIRREAMAEVGESEKTMAEARALERKALAAEAAAARELAAGRLARAEAFLEDVRSGKATVADLPGVAPEQKAEAKYRVKQAVRGNHPHSLIGWF